MRIETKTIGGFRYRMEQVGMEEGEQIVLRLSRPVAALFSRLAGVAGGSTSIEQLAASGLEPLLQTLSGRDLRYTRKKLAAKCVVWLPDGKKEREWPLVEVYDAHFAGRYLDWLLWLKWGVQMNGFFGDALDRLDSMLAAQKVAKEARAAASQSKSPPGAETAGGSGASSSPSTVAPD
jgi:hypothetical protein